MSIFDPNKSGVAKGPGGRLKEYAYDAGFMIVGSVIYSASVSFFTAPNNIAPGGITGISTVLNYVFKTPIGTMIFILNLPLFLLGYKLISKQFLIKSVICTALVSVTIDLMTAFLPQLVYGGSGKDKLLAALFGGVLSGAGLGIVFLRGATTGGTDIASRLIKLKFKFIPMGRMMMIIDLVIISIAAVVYHSIDSALYAIISIFASARVVDSILYGFDNGKMMIIISDKNMEIAGAITEEINRGITILKGRGYYTGYDKEVLLCAVRLPETAKLRSIVRRIDPQAFMIMCEAGDVIGEGFKPITKEDI